MTSGERQLARVIGQVSPITNRLVDKVDACPHEAAILGYLLGLRRGYLDYHTYRVGGELTKAVEDFITEVTEYGLPD